jgi:putative ABC transport system permease protein
VSPIRQAVRDVDPSIPVADVRLLQESVRRATTREMVTGATMAAFATIAFLRAAVGTYGMLVNLVRRRVGEFGIRMALGATPRRIRRTVLGQAGLLLAPALLVGAGGAVALGHLLRAILYGVTPTHVSSLLSSVGLLAAVGVLAAWIPARRAAQVDPEGLIRSE